MNFRESVFIFSFILSLGTIFKYATGGVMHSHSNSDVNKERLEDGAYSPRDHKHFDGDAHYSEFDHEAILGSHKEAEEFDSLEPAEAKRRLAILLEKMDLDGDKQISRKELKAWIMRSFKMLSEEEATERLEEADEDGNGIVTWKEYLADAYGVEDDSGALSIGEDSEQLIADDKLTWKAADVNGDGQLDAAEWVAFSHPEEHPAMLPIILEQTLKDKDQDGDGAISFKEFVAGRAHDHDAEWLKIEKDKFDSELDKDGDGLLKGNEILSWVVPSNEEIADEEVDHLFVSSDDNHDDVLSFDEVLEHHDTFVGSEATDYGDHLHNIHHFQDEL